MRDLILGGVKLAEQIRKPSEFIVPLTTLDALYFIYHRDALRMAIDLAGGYLAAVNADAFVGAVAQARVLLDLSFSIRAAKDSPERVAEFVIYEFKEADRHTRLWEELAPTENHQTELNRNDSLIRDVEALLGRPFNGKWSVFDKAKMAEASLTYRAAFHYCSSCIHPGLRSLDILKGKPAGILAYLAVVVPLLAAQQLSHCSLYPGHDEIVCAAMSDLMKEADKRLHDRDPLPV